MLSKKSSRLAVVIALLSITRLASQNLVLNGSFELYSACPNYVAQIYLASAWNHPLNHLGTADFFHACSSVDMVSVPDNYCGTEQPEIGQGYAGLVLILPEVLDSREYIVTKLFQPMVSGVTYGVSFRYSLADYSSLSTGQLSIAFPKEAPQGTGSYGPINIDPAFTLGTPVTKTDGWTLASFSYTATGGEQYMIVGNFNNDANTPTLFLGNFGLSGCYVYLDDFDVIPCTGVDLGPDTVICQGNTIVLNAGSQDAIYRWQDGSDDSLFTVINPGTYWVEVRNACAIVRDTITIDFKEEVEIVPRQDTIICEDATISLALSSQAISEAIWQDNSPGTTYFIDAPGTYWVNITDQCGTYSDTIRVEQTQCDCPVYFPNIFSPNGDRINDLFVPALGCPPIQYKLVVFDRSGNAVFQSESPDAAWDGTYKGKVLPPAVYTYALIVTSPAGVRITKSGSVTLIR